MLNIIGSLVWINDMWHLVSKTRNEEKELLLVSPLWWKPDKWILAKEVEHIKENNGQIEYV